MIAPATRRSTEKWSRLPSPSLAFLRQPEANQPRPQLADGEPPLNQLLIPSAPLALAVRRLVEAAADLRIEGLGRHRLAPAQARQHGPLGLGRLPRPARRREPHR